MTAASLQIRAPSGPAEIDQAVDLVRVSLEPGWRFGGGSLRACVIDPLLAFRRGELVGVAALYDGARGAVNVVAVHPGARRRGIGTALVAAAREELRRRGCAEVGAGGGGPYLWPGIPRDIPGAVELFAAAGWRFADEVHDLTRSLIDFVTPQEVVYGARAEGLRFGRAVAAEQELLVALAADEWYPGWADHFATAATENIVVGRDRREQVVAALIVDPPGQAQRWEPMLGPGCTTIGCVGTLRVVRGRGIGTALVAAASELLRDAGGAACHIGWTVLLSFYGRLGYERWRTYLSASAPRPAGR